MVEIKEEAKETTERSDQRAWGFHDLGGPGRLYSCTPKLLVAAILFRLFSPLFPEHARGDLAPFYQTPAPDQGFCSVGCICMAPNYIPVDVLGGELWTNKIAGACPDQPQARDVVG